MPVTDEQVKLKLDRVVLATELPPASTVTTQFAMRVAKHFSSRLVLANVIDLSVATRNEEAVVGFPIEEMQRASNQGLEKLSADLREAGIPSTAHTLEAHHPASAIVGLAHDVDADLIIIGTHARHGLNKFILGSCAEGIIRHARCPVMTVGPNVLSVQEEPLLFRNVLFATELRPGAAEKARTAFAFAQEGGKVWLCHLIEHPGKTVGDTLGTQLKFESELDRLVPQSSYRWWDVECVVDYGRPAPEILKLASKVGADLIVLGARRSASWLAHLSDGTVGNIVSEATCPVLTIG